MKSFSINKAFILFTVAVFAALLLPVLAQKGMFMDGILYSSLAMNLANGLSSFWSPGLYPEYFPEFYGHPPMAFYLQSFFFRIFNDHFISERLYNFLAAVISALLISGIWRIVVPQHLKHLFWLPVFFWIITPLVFWSFTNNMLENTVTVFSMLSVFFILYGLRQKQLLPWLFFAALAIPVGVLTKGPVALYPLSVLFLHWLVFRSFSFLKMLLYSLFVAAIPAFILFSLFHFSADANRFLLGYFDNQIIGSFTDSAVPAGKLFLITRIFQELLPVILIAALLAAVAYFTKMKIQRQPEMFKTGIFFLLTALAASLPIMISPKQLGFYLVPSFPLYTLAFAAFIAPVAAIFLVRFAHKKLFVKFFTYFSIFALAAVFIISAILYRQPSRDRQLLHDLELIAAETGEEQVVALDYALGAHYPLRFYTYRYYNIRLDGSGKQYEYFVSIPTTPHPVPDGFAPVELPLQQLLLYKKF